MTRLPDATALGTRPTPEPNLGVVSYRATHGQEEARAAGLGEIAGSVKHSALSLKKVFEEERHKADVLRAEEAINALREQQLDLTYNPESGFINKQGSDAVNGEIHKQYSAKLKDKAKQIEEQLQTPQQKQLFRQRSEPIGLQFGENLLRHVEGQRKAYEKQTFEGTVAVEVRSAAAQPNDPNVVETSLLRVTSAANAIADSQGYPEGSEPRKALINAAQGKVHNAVLGQLLATEDFVNAGEYFAKVKDTGVIDPNTAKLVTRAVAEGEQKQKANNYNSLLLQTRDDLKGLRLLEKAVTNDSTLDEQRKNIILGRIVSRQDVVERRQQIENEKVLRRIGNEIKGINETTMAGYDTPAGTLLTAYNAARGTELEADAVRAIRLAETTSQFRRMPPAQREAELAKVEADIRADPTKGDRQYVNALQKINENINREVEANPYGFAVAQGYASAAPVNWQNPAETAEALHERFRVGRGMQQHYRAPYKPLQPQEVRTIKQELDKLDPVRKSAYLANLAAASGGSPEGRGGYVAMMAQLAEDDPVTAAAGYNAARGRQEVAQRMLNGQAILNPPKKEDGKSGGTLLPMPPDTQLRKDFDVDAPISAYGGNVKARNIDYQAARAIYADLVSKSNIKDTSQIDSKLWEQAINEATGGIESVNGQKTILPPGMPKGEFVQGARQRLTALERSNRLPENVTADRLWRLPMEPIAVGVYAIREGNGYMVDREGRRIELNYNVAPAEAEMAPRRWRGTLRPAPREEAYQ